VTLILAKEISHQENKFQDKKEIKITVEISHTKVIVMIEITIAAGTNLIKVIVMTEIKVMESMIIKDQINIIID